MIRYRVGNLVEAVEPAIIHGCNARGVMGAGVAKAIKTAFPEAFSLYSQAHKKQKLALGDVIWARAEQKWIGNCITQKDFGPGDRLYFSYEACAKCLTEVAYFAASHQIKTLAMPKIGCGLAGANWDIVLRLIENLLPIEIIVYVLNAEEIPSRC